MFAVRPGNLQYRVEQPGGSSCELVVSLLAEPPGIFLAPDLLLSSWLTTNDPGDNP